VQGQGPLGRSAEGDARLARDGVGLRTVIRRPMGIEVVRRKGTGQLLVAERLEVAGGGEVPRPPVSPGEHAVRDLADQRLHEAVLPPLGRAGVSILDEHLLPHQVAQPWLELGRGHAVHARQRADRERLAEDGGILEDRAGIRLEAVEPGGDQGVEGLGHVEVGQIADRPEGVPGPLDATVEQQLPDRLDGVQRDALGARQETAAHV
jgi:hypothetical protein